MTAPRRATLILIALLAVGSAAVTACGPGSAPRTTFPPPGSTPGAPGDATAATVRQVIGTLAAAGLPAAESTRPYRPPEGPLLAGAPRTIVQAALPDDPNHGFIVVYALASSAAALAAAQDHAAYIARHPGGIVIAPDAHVSLRVVGSTVVFFTWLPGAALDKRTATIEAVLETMGTGVPIPG
jgi:hypothetical protein